MESTRDQIGGECGLCSDVVLWSNLGEPEPAHDTKQRIFHLACATCDEREYSYPATICSVCRHTRWNHMITCNSTFQSFFSSSFTIKISIGENQKCDFCQFLSETVKRADEFTGTNIFPMLNEEQTYLQVSFTDDKRLFWNLAKKVDGSHDWGGITGYFADNSGRFSPKLNQLTPNLRWDKLRSWISSSLNFSGTSPHQSSQQRAKSTRNNGTVTEGLNSAMEKFPIGAGPSSRISLSHRLRAIQDFKLVDVQGQCIIDAPPRCEYVTLSYVWGRHVTETIQTTKENVSERMLPGALENITLPLTITDSIEVCRTLRIKYLWVDSLCIVQDDWERKLNQIKNMDKIYKACTFCIVAAAGKDANSGLPGVSRRRLWSLPVIRLHGVDVLVEIDGASEVIRKSKWNTRGWTFQEEFLSERLLYFTDYGAFFYDRDADDTHYLSEHGNLSLHIGYRESRDHYSAIVIYTTKELTNPGDILNAVTGVLTDLLKDQVSFGMSHLHFDEAILWEPDTTISNLRSLSSVSIRPPIGNNIFPSWSWTSMNCPITFGRSCRSVACWALNDAEADSPGVVKILVPAPYEDNGNDPDHRSSKEGVRGYNIAAGLAWTYGCVPKECPSGLAKPRKNMDDFGDDVEERWSSHREYWIDVFGEYLSEPPFSNDEIEAAKKPGRVLVHSQEAWVKIAPEQDTSQKYPWLQRFNMYSDSGALSGRIDIHRNFKLHPVRGKMRLLALSVANRRISAEDELSEYRSARFWPFGDDIYKTNFVVSVNVMLIQSSDIKNLDGAIVNRLGITELTLKEWISLRRRCRTLIIE